MYFSTGYVHQVDTRTCTAASTAMMMNFIARKRLALYSVASQLAILAYEKPRDALADSVQRGSDPLGWSRAATGYSRLTGHPTTYRWEAYASASTALRRAALQIARTGKPVGLLVLHGTHAMVMTGFVATANPATSTSWTLQSVWVSDPNSATTAGHHHLYAANASPINKYTELDATTFYNFAWYGKYVIVAPQF